MKYEVPEGLSSEQLIKGIRDVTERYGWALYSHKNGGLYYTTDGIVINIDGKSYWGIKYHPADISTGINKVEYDVSHSRPLFEFTDGRFTQHGSLNR